MRNLICAGAFAASLVTIFATSGANAAPLMGSHVEGAKSSVVLAHYDSDRRYRRWSWWRHRGDGEWWWRRRNHRWHDRRDHWRDRDAYRGRSERRWDRY